MAKSSKPKHGGAGGAAAVVETSENSTGSRGNSVNIKKARRTRKSIPKKTPQQRSSIYRGVTRHRWTGRYEAHLWDKHSWNESQNKKGRQVYLGAYDDEEAAARAYDLAALKYWGQNTVLNFPLPTYEEEVKEMDGQSKEEYIGSLRRKSSGFSRGVSKYRGVARHHHNGRWEARIGRVLGNKYLYLGTYATQEEAATAYDMAAVKYRGLNAVTNFDLSRYAAWLEPLQDNIDNVIIPKGNIDDDTTQNHSQDIGLTFFRDQSENPTLTETTIPSPNLRGGDATSPALGIFMKSSMFKEMTMTNQTIASNKSPSSTFELEPEPEPEPEIRIGPIRSCFPDDIQTSFDFQDSSSFAEEHDIIFGNYDSFVSSVLEYGIDA